MILTKKIKIWLMVSQAFIIIGIGHGILPFLILEPLGIISLFNIDAPQDSGDLSNITRCLVGLTSLAGQVAIIASIFIKSNLKERWLYLSGIVLLWCSLFVFAYGIRKDNYSVLVVSTCIPFLYCTIRTLSGYINKAMKDLKLKIIDF